MLYDNSMLAVWVGSSLLAFTGGDWALLAAAVIGSSGLGGLGSLWLGLRKYKADNRQRAAESAAQVKTVAAAEAEAAMRIMGASVVRLEAEVVAAVARVERCEEAWLEHIKTCPLWKDRPTRQNRSR
jgi:hypothetical protein